MAQRGRKPKRSVQEEFYEIEEMDSFVKEKSSPMDFKIKCKFKTEKQKLMYDTILNNRITFVNGVAGSGKTLIALMAGLECIKNPKINISQMTMVKPIVEMTTQRNGIGALPGELEDKIGVYFTSFYDNLAKICGNETTKYLKNSGYIQDSVLNYLRGSTFGKYDKKGEPIGTFCILDESQNTSVHEMKTFISRIGESSKLIILGDSDQVDVKLGVGELSGLEDAIKRLKGIEQIGFIEFTEDDIVRDPFLIEIMKKYKRDI